MTRVIIVHGYRGAPATSWKPWLKLELEKAGISVDNPLMPNPLIPIKDKWVRAIEKIVGTPGEDVFLVGHSLGCISILHYLQALQPGQRIGGCVLVAGFSKKFPEYEGKYDSFFEPAFDWGKLRQTSPAITAIHSKDDTRVNYAELDDFSEKLGANTVLVDGFGHFSSLDGVFTSPLIRDELLKVIDSRAK